MHKHLQKSTREISTLLGNKQLGGSPCKAYFRSKTILAKFQRWEDHTRAVEFRIYYLLRSFGQCILSKVKVRMQDIHKKAENVERKISKMFNSKWNYFFLRFKRNMTLSLHWIYVHIWFHKHIQRYWKKKWSQRQD